MNYLRQSKTNIMENANAKCHQTQLERFFFKQWIDLNGVYCFKKGHKVLKYAHAYACGAADADESIVNVDSEGKNVIKFTIIKNQNTASYKIKFSEFEKQVYIILGGDDFNERELVLGAIVAYWDAYTDYIHNTYKILLDTPFSRIGEVRKPAKQPLVFDDQPNDKYATVGNHPLDSQKGPCLHGIYLDVPCPTIITRPSDLDLNEQAL